MLETMGSEQRNVQSRQLSVGHSPWNLYIPYPVPRVLPLPTQDKEQSPFLHVSVTSEILAQILASSPEPLSPHPGLRLDSITFRKLLRRFLEAELPEQKHISYVSTFI